MNKCALCESEEVFEIVIIQKFLFSKNLKIILTFNFEGDHFELIRIFMIMILECVGESPRQGSSQKPISILNGVNIRREAQIKTSSSDIPKNGMKTNTSI